MSESWQIGTANDARPVLSCHCQYACIGRATFSRAQASRALIEQEESQVGH